MRIGNKRVEDCKEFHTSIGVFLESGSSEDQLAEFPKWRSFFGSTNLVENLLISLCERRTHESDFLLVNSSSMRVKKKSQRIYHSEFLNTAVHKNCKPLSISKCVCYLN